jgi:hypothetical protein
MEEMMTPAQEDRLLQAYKDLINYIHWLAGRTQIQNHWAMSTDDIEAELLLNLTKITIVYDEKPYDEFLLLARTSLHNRVKSLLYRHTVTQRKNELYSHGLGFDHEQFEADDDRLSGSKMIPSCVMSEALVWEQRDPDEIMAAVSKLDAFIENLSEFDKEVLDALLGGNERLGMYLDLHRLRKDWVFKEPIVVISPHLVARALCVNVKEVERSYSRIGSIFVASYIK